MNSLLLLALLLVPAISCADDERTDIVWLTEAWNARSELKRAQPQLFHEVTTLLNSADPIRIGQYDAATATIIPRLRHEDSVADVQRIIHSEFVLWFGEKSAGSADTYAMTATRIWEVWQKHRDSMPYQSPYFTSMQEPLLNAAPPSQRAFAIRFTWVRSFRDPIVVRVWREGVGYKLRAVRLQVSQDSNKSEIASDTTRDLNEEEVVEVEGLAASADLWRPFNKDEKLATAGEMDGSTWSFERVSHQHYSAVELSSPTSYSHYGPRPGVDYLKVRDTVIYVRAGLYLLGIAGLTPTHPDEIF